MKNKTIMTVGEALGRISKLNTESAQAEHTDIGDIWDTLNFARDALRLVAHETVGDDMRPGKIDKVCQDCGGEISFEGWISWDVDAQEFVVDDVCDKGHHCKKCDGQTYARDVEWKPFCIEIEYEPTEGGAHGKTATFRFDTRDEVAAFHDGMRKGAKIGEWEVAYTDEES